MRRIPVVAQLLPFNKMLTQERNTTGVMSVARVSARAQTCKLTRESTQGRSSIGALNVVKALTRPHICMPICPSTQERNPTVEKVIGRASVIVLIIAEFTLEGNHTDVGIVVNALVVAQIFIPIRQLALKRNRTSVMSVGSASF